MRGEDSAASSALSFFSGVLFELTLVNAGLLNHRSFIVRMMGYVKDLFLKRKRHIASNAPIRRDVT